MEHRCEKAARRRMGFPAVPEEADWQSAERRVRRPEVVVVAEDMGPASVKIEYTGAVLVARVADVAGVGGWNSIRRSAT